MDKLICKAKTIDHKGWVYGYFFKTWEDCYLLWGMTNEVPYMIKIDKNTLYRQTGVADKDGVEIWENDIVEMNNYRGGKHKTQVYFQDGKFTVDGSNYSFKDIKSKSIKVVGNIFDEIK